jgi:hypothetical protein
MTVAAVKAQAKTGPAPVKATAAPPSAAAPSRRRGITPLTPMRVQAAKSMTKLADSMKESHPDMLSHQHVRDAARMLRAGNEEAAQRHLRAAMFSLTPQSLMRNGMHTDDHHIAARDAMHGVHRHLLLVKDVADVAAKNQAAIRRDSYGDDSSSPPPVTSPVRADPNAGYGPGALAQKPTVRQPPGNQALNAPARSSSGGSDPAVADPVGVQPRGSKQFSYGWRDLDRVIDLVGPKGFIHGWIFVGIPAPGDKVSIPGHGPGKVVSGTAKHARVKLASGHIATISHDGNAAGPGKLVKSASAPPAPKEDEADWRAANRKQASASIAKGRETLFHGTAHEFKPGDIIDAQHANAGVTRLHEGNQYAFASTDPGEATFAGKASRPGGHVYRVEPVDKYEFDPHQGSATSRRTTGGFRVVEEVAKESGKKLFSLNSMTKAQKKAYISKGTVPEGMAPRPSLAQQHSRENVMSTDLAAYGWGDILAVIELASSGGRHIPGTSDTYSHGWKLRAGLPGKKELYSKLPTADKMSRTALKQHMDLHHNGGMPIGGRRVGPKNPSREDLLATHEAMHADEPLSVNPPGSADNSALKGGLSRTSTAHTHGNVTGMANRLAGIGLSAETGKLASTTAPRGKPGGPGLYGAKGNMHSPYMQNIVKALIEKRGMDPGKAYAVAWGAMRKWSRGGGKVHPEVRAAAAGGLGLEKAAEVRAHGHAASWSDVGRRIDLAAAPPPAPAAAPASGQAGGALPARVAAGSATGGQFSAGGGSQPAKGKTAATGKAGAKPPLTAHQQHVAHVAHLLKVSTAKAGLLVTAQDDRAKASALIKQRDALVKAMASAGGKTGTGQAGAKTAKTATTATTAPAAAKTAAASTTAAKPAASAAVKKSTTAAKPSASATSAAGLKTQVAALNTQISALLAQASQATAQAAKMK